MMEEKAKMPSVILRPVEISDVDYTHKWHSNPELYQTLVGPFRDVSLEVEKAWIAERVANSDQEVNRMICLEGQKAPIGLISVREIDWMARKAHLTGIFIGDAQHRGKGYGYQALCQMMQYCFDTLELNKVWTHILDDNQASIRIFEKCGYKIEGHLRQHTYKDGQFRDVVLVGLLAEDYYRKQNA